MGINVCWLFDVKNGTMKNRGIYWLQDIITIKIACIIINDQINIFRKNIWERFIFGYETRKTM